jgi:hypothetical protein
MYLRIRISVSLLFSCRDRRYDAAPSEIRRQKVLPMSLPTPSKALGIPAAAAKECAQRRGGGRRPPGARATADVSSGRRRRLRRTPKARCRRRPFDSLPRLPLTPR